MQPSRSGSKFFRRRLDLAETSRQRSHIRWRYCQKTRATLENPSARRPIAVYYLGWLSWRLAKPDYRMQPVIDEKKDEGRVFATRMHGAEDDVALEETTVVGVRTGARWAFYYQLNVYMNFSRPRTALVARIKHGKQFTGIKSYCRPLP